MPVVDESGRELAAGRDIGVLRQDFVGEQETQAFAKARLTWEKSGLTEWNFGDLPERITLAASGHHAPCAFPALARLYHGSAPGQGTRPLAEIVRQPGVIVAMVSVVFAQMVMMVPMSITSVHMKALQYPLSAVSLVISAHTLGMFAFSIISGRMTDRWGRGQVIIVGMVVMIVSCLMAAPATGLVALIVALFLLGLGWNFAYVSGSALLSDQLSPGERAKTQGFNDMMLNLTSAASQVISGLVYAVGGYGVMALAAAAAALVPLAMVIWWQAAGRQITAPSSP